MRREPSSWLPRSTLGSVRVARAIAQAVDAWSGRWLAGDGWRGAACFVPVDEAGWTVLRRGEGVDLTGRAGAVQELGFAMLGARPRSDLTPADAKLLRRIAGEALDDLHAAIGAACPATGTAGERWRLPIGDMLALDVAEAALGEIARRTFAPIAKPMPLAPRREAAADHRVACAASLGRATLSVHQLDTLEPGDVVLLDRRADDIVPLAVAGRPSDLRIALVERRAPTILQD